MQKVCVVLTSSMVSLTQQKNDIASLKQMLDGKRVNYTEIDCSNEANKDVRDHYFEISGVRGNYPQVFLQDTEAENIVYLGSFSEIQNLNEMSDIPAEIIQANNIQTFDDVFKDVAKVTK